MNSNTRYVIVDSEQDIYAEVSKEVMAGQTVVRFQIGTNIKIFTVESSEICEALFLGIDKEFALFYYNKTENAANVYTTRDSVGIKVFSYHLN